MAADSMKDMNQRVIADFRANGGKVTFPPFDAAPMILITTTGAKSGQQRVSPLVYTRDGDRYVIIASKGGAPENPDWYHNLVANPELTVEVGAEKFQARATVADEPERTRLFDQQAAQMPNFAEYQRNTERRIPVVVLERAQ